MKFGDSSRSHRKTWFIGGQQFIGIYTFNCRDLRRPRLISHAAPATPQKYRVSRETRTVKTPSARGPALSSFFLQRSTCYRSRFGGNRTPINRPKIFGPAEFTADVRFFRRFAGNRAASRSVEPSSSWKFVRSAPHAIMRCDDDDDG